jgi:hypothetical protein
VALGAASLLWGNLYVFNRLRIKVVITGHSNMSISVESIFKSNGVIYESHCTRDPYAIPRHKLAKREKPRPIGGTVFGLLVRSLLTVNSCAYIIMILTIRKIAIIRACFPIGVTVGRWLRKLAS